MKRGVCQRRHGRFFSPYPLVIHHPLTVSSLYGNQKALDRQRGRWGTPAGSPSNSGSLQGAQKLSFNSLSHEADDVLRPLSRTGVIPTGNHLTAPLQSYQPPYHILTPTLLTSNPHFSSSDILSLFESDHRNNHHKTTEKTDPLFLSVPSQWLFLQSLCIRCIIKNNSKTQYAERFWIIIRISLK